MQPEETILTPEQADAEYQERGRAIAALLDSEEEARANQQKLAEVGRALRDKLTATEQTFATNDAEALRATIFAGPEAADKRSAADSLGRDVRYLRRALEYFNVFDLEDARLALFDAEAATAEGRYQYEQARSAAHDARLFAIVAQASAFNGGQLQIEDGGIAAGLRQLVTEMFDKARDARRAAREHQERVAEERAAYQKRESERQ